MKIYSAEIKWVNGKTYTFAVEAANEKDARSDLYTAVATEMKMPIGMIRLHDLRLRTCKLVAEMTPVKNCTSNGAPWAWMAFPESKKEL